MNQPEQDATTAAAHSSVAPARPRRFRWQAFGIHLAISLVILGALLYLLFFHWFPGYLFDTDGGWQALRVIAGVDIILGPLLTLIAANPLKSARELRMDFAVIGVIQAAALSAGVWLAWDNRPYALLWYDGSFQSQPVSSFRDEPAAREWIERQDGATPLMVFVDLPEDLEARSVLLRKALAEGTSALFSAPLYRAWPADAPRITRYATAARQWIAQDAAREKTYRARLAELGLQDAATLPVPTMSRYSTYFLLLETGTLAPSGIVRMQPQYEMLAGLTNIPQHDATTITPQQPSPHRSAPQTPTPQK